MKKRFSIKSAWYALMIASGLLPLIIISLIIGPRIYWALLDDTLLHNHAINNRIAVALGSEISRIVSVLENKSDPITHVLEKKTEKDFLDLLLKKVLAREDFVTAIAVMQPGEEIVAYADRHNDISDSQGSEMQSLMSLFIKNKSSLGLSISLKDDSPYVSPVLKSRVDDSAFSFLIAISMGSQKKHEGILVAEVAAHALINKIGARFARPDSRIYIIDRGGELLTMLANAEYMPGKPLEHIDIVSNLSTDSVWDDKKEYRGINGEIVFGTSGKISLVNWNVISEVSRSDILSPIYETIFTYFVVVLAVILLFIWLGVLIARRMITTINILTDSFRQAARQDYSPISIESPLEEFQQLAEGYDAMVSEIKNHEQKLNKSKEMLEQNEKRFSIVTENIHEVLLIVSTYWEEVIYVSPAYENIWGLSCESLYKKPESWADAIHPSDRAQVHSAIMKLDLAFAPVQFPEFRILSSDRETKWILTKAYPVYDDKGEMTSYVYVMQDVTQQKQAQLEQKKLQHQLQQSQKMEAIGQLTGGIAHDFNNMLTAIMGYTSLALDRFGKGMDPKLVEYLSEVDIAGERARSLISQLLVFSRESASEPEPINLSPLIKEVTKMLRTSFPANIEIRNRIYSDLPPVLMDPVRLHQLIMNLCINARDAIEGNGSITISALHVKQQSGDCNACFKSFQGDFVELMVEDTGYGIDPAAIDRIFDPFFTTKELGKGTGMGLSIIHGIVHDLDGHILVNTGPTGTSFRLFFPAIEKLVESDRKDEEEVKLTKTGQGQRILIVDDEKSVAQFEGELLNHHGYQATVMTDSEMAAAEFLDNPDKYDLVITDQTMPKMTGTELAVAILKVRPDLPIILCTGYIHDLDPQEVSEIGIRELQVKPVHDRELVHAVQKYLSQPV